MKRRSFLASILAAGVAQAAVGSSILMPVRPLLFNNYGRSLEQVMVMWDQLIADGIERAQRTILVAPPGFAIRRDGALVAQGAIITGSIAP